MPLSRGRFPPVNWVAVSAPRLSSAPKRQQSVNEEAKAYAGDAGTCLRLGTLATITKGGRRTMTLDQTGNEFRRKPRERTLCC